VVYMGLMPGMLYAYNASSGALLWKQHFGAVLKEKTGQAGEFAPIITIIG
jgi:outer membrane protein assembly factor BamB